jgi:hypothetical membrane protein
MKFKWPVIPITGLTAIVIYLVFTLLAFLRFPGIYNPMINWLSDLGNPDINPSGAIFYNSGCIITSLVLVLFYIGLSKWNTGDKRMKTLLIIAQIMGVCSSISLITAAVFPLGPHTFIHSWASKLLSVFLGFFLTFSATALLKNPAFIKWFAYYGFLTALVNFIYGVLLPSVFLAEWISIGMFIIYVFLIAFNSRSSCNSTKCTA